jgi:hypothetical protein
VLSTLTQQYPLEHGRRQWTELAEQLDPEGWHKIMDRFFAIL